MIAYMEILGIPLSVVFIIVAALFVINLIGELLEFRGRVVPEFVKFRKYFARKKQERETLAKMPEMMDNVSELLDDVGQHYSSDNIAMRDCWMSNVDSKLDDYHDKLDNYECVINNINSKIDKNSEDIIDLLLDNKRETIIAFAEKVCNDDFPATREQFTRILKIYSEYERIIGERGLTNGEIDVAHKIIQESYQHRLLNHTFVEDVRWHGLEMQ